MKSYKIQSVEILERGDKRDIKTASYRAVIAPEDNDVWVISGYVRSSNIISLENCAWSALQYFIGENTASYNDYEVVYDRILSPWESFEL